MLPAICYHHNYCCLYRYAEIQDKSSDISIPLNVANVDPVEENQNNKENEVENNLAAAVGLVEGDSEDEEEEELDAEEEQAIKDRHIDIVISDDEELS